MKTTHLAFAALLALGFPALASAQPYMGPGPSHHQRPSWAEGNEPLTTGGHYHGMHMGRHSVYAHRSYVRHAGYPMTGRSTRSRRAPTWAEGNQVNMPAANQ